MANRYRMDLTKSAINKVNIEYSHINNLGDSLAPIVVQWMLEREGIPVDRNVGQTRHFVTIGSIVYRGVYDATIWGAGILNQNSAKILLAQRGLRKLDVRAVRGPRTRDALVQAGFTCPEVYGDPAILLPYIYPNETLNRGNRIGLILHHATALKGEEYNKEFKCISMLTTDYKQFLYDLTECRVVISSSLHGIILAESYGIPAIYLWEDGPVGEQGVKFSDWYESTGRNGIEACTSIEQALEADPPELPSLDFMRGKLMATFPYDIWNNSVNESLKTEYLKG